MNQFRPWSESDRIGSEMLKLGSVLLLAIGTGVIMNISAPLFALVGALAFTAGAISLHVGSFPRTAIVEAESPTALEKATSSPFLFSVLAVAFFLSITIPKSGRTIRNIPITTANIAILCLFGCWILAFIFRKNKGAPIPLFRSFMLFMLYGIAAFGIGLSYGNPMRYNVIDFVAFIGFVPVYFVVSDVLRTKAQLHKIFVAIVISFVLICGYGLLQLRFGFETVAVPGITRQAGMIMYEGVGRWNVVAGGKEKLYSTFQNGNVFGNHLATFLPFFAGIYLQLRSFKKKLFASALFLIAWYVLIMTYSRGALFGTLCGFGVFAVISKKVRVKSLIALALVCLFLVGVLWQYADRPEMERYNLQKMSDDPNSFSAGRLERFKEMLAGFQQLPFTAKLFGLGLGGELSSPQQWHFLYVDNLYLTFLFKTGLVGTIILAVLIMQILLTLLKMSQRMPNPQMQILMYGGISGIVASLVHDMFDTLWLFPPLAANFWFLVGITMSIGVIETQTAAEQSQPASEPIKSVQGYRL